MTNLLDIHLLPVSRYEIREHSDKSVLFSSEPARRAARSRGVDRLMLYLLMVGDPIISSNDQKGLLAELAKKFYATQGSVTSALKVVAEELNQALLERNRIASERGHQGLGLLSQWVVREEQFYLAQSGAVKAIWITEQGTQSFDHVDMQAKGLGLIRSAPVYFSQISYQSNSTLILSGKNDPAWNDQTWTGLQGQGPESIRRRLSNAASGDFDVLIAQMRPGKGKIHVLQSIPGLSGEIPAEKSAPPKTTHMEPAEQFAHVSPGTDAFQSEPQPESNWIHDELPEKPAVQAVTASEFSPLPQTSSTLEDELPDFQRLDASTYSRKKEEPSRVSQSLRSAGKSLRNGLRGGLTSFGLIMGKLIPEDLFRTVPSSVMAAMAIIIPLIVVTIASVAYFQLGRSTQFQIYFSQAEQTAIRASQQSDLLDKRVNWISVLSLLDEAENYQITAETQALRSQAQFSLDSIDLIKRVDYQPAIQGGLPADINVTKIVVSADDLYLLDSKSGKVLRARPTSQGYQLDSSFLCGPTSGNIISVNRLVDIIAWPASYEPKASVLGIDQGGNLAFCQPGSPIMAIRLALPQSAIGSVKAIDINRNELFVMSQGSRAVWAFTQKAYDQAPRDYFTNDQEKPENLDTTVSFVVDRDDLYLLHQDGNLTYCSTLDITGVPIRCQKATFIDMRPGRENNPLTTSTPFKQLMISSPPDTSLFFLEAANHSIFHFSLRNLVFQRHYMPQKALSLLPATAFTVYPERRALFLAIGNEVFFGSIP